MYLARNVYSPTKNRAAEGPILDRFQEHLTGTLMHIDLCVTTRESSKILQIHVHDEVFQPKAFVSGDIWGSFSRRLGQHCSITAKTFRQILNGCHLKPP